MSRSLMFNKAFNTVSYSVPVTKLERDGPDDRETLPITGLKQ